METHMKLKINKRFQELHRKLTSEETKELTEAIKADGVRDPIVVWKDTIIDGHNRYEIATKLKIEPHIVVKTFESEDDAERWILRHQLARRNLSSHDYKLTLGRLYNAEKKSRGGDQIAKVQNEPLEESQGNTSQKIAAAAKVSPATVKRDGKYAAAFDSLPKAAKTLIENDPKLATEAAVIKLSKMDSDVVSQIARDVRVGNISTFTDVVKVTPKAAGNGKPKRTKKEEIAIQRSKLKKTAEALQRAIDDLQRLLPNATCHDSLLDLATKVIVGLEKWK